MTNPTKKSCGKLSVSQKSISAQRGSADVGKLIGIVISLIVLGFLGFGVSRIIKSMGEAGSQYSGAMVDTKRKAAALQCQMNLHTIRRNLRMYSIEKESFPPSLKTLVDWGADSQLLYCTVPDGQEYVYITGQNENMPGQNVLVYEQKGAHDGRCNVLRVDGQIDLLTPEQVQAAVTKTYISLR
jgi:prepilin-type processing-associated H-X9-DG protein